jgi:predicted deacetylase
MKAKALVMDFDDLCDATREKLTHVQRLKAAMPNLKVTLFTIPTRTSPETIAAAKELGEWITLGMHGWRHTLGECWSWTAAEARDKMQRAFDAGIDGKVFRAPKWVIDAETYLAAKELGWVIADHKDFRILGSGCRVYTYNRPLRDLPYIRVHGHLPNVSDNGIEEHFSEFVFPPERDFLTIQDVAWLDKEA